MPPSFLGFASDDSLKWSPPKVWLVAVDLSFITVTAIIVLRLGLFYVFQGRRHYRIKNSGDTRPWRNPTFWRPSSDRIRLLWYWLPNWYQSKWHRQVGQEASLFEQCPSEHPQEDRCEEPRCCHLSPAATVLKELCGQACGILESVQKFPSSAQLL